MNVSTWSIKNPIPALMLFVLLTFGGLLSFNAMKVQNFPDIDLPTISVTVALPGASPAQLENDVARKIENSIATLQEAFHPQHAPYRCIDACGWPNRVGQRQRAGAVGHADGIDVVLEQHRDAVQRPAHLARGTFGVTGFGLRQGIGGQFDDGVDGRPGIVDGGDAVQVGLGQLP